jgi:hypothetical protein
MPRAKLPQPTDTEAVVRQRIELRRPQFEKMLRQNTNVEAALQRAPMPELVVRVIAELMENYDATRNERTTIGETLRLLAVVRRLLKPLIIEKALRPRDMRRRVDVLKRFIYSELGTYEHTFDVLSESAANLLAHLQAGRSCACLAQEIDGIAENESRLLREWQKQSRKVEGRIEMKRYLCGCLRVVWEQFSAPDIRDSKSKRRRFITAVLVEFEIPRPDDNDYQTLDAWIETDVSSKPVFAPTAG